MAQRKLTQTEMPVADHAFYGLVWAGTVLTERVDRALTKAHDLPVSWFEVMLWLASSPDPVPASVLGNSTMLSRSQVSRVVDALQSRGLVTRTPSPRDARSVEVALTPEGRMALRGGRRDATRLPCAGLHRPPRRGGSRSAQHGVAEAQGQQGRLSGTVGRVGGSAPGGRSADQPRNESRT